MTINAHLIKEINIKTNNETIIIEKILEKSPTFNLNRNKKIFELFQEEGYVNLNEDLSGELSMDKQTWEKIVNNLVTNPLSSENLNILKKITLDLKNNEIVYYACF